MIIPPRGVGLDPETTGELDDEFFASDPGAYFGARLAMLLAPAPYPLDTCRWRSTRSRCGITLPNHW